MVEFWCIKIVKHIFKCLNNLRFQIFMKTRYKNICDVTNYFRTRDTIDCDIILYIQFVSESPIYI